MKKNTKKPFKKKKPGIAKKSVIPNKKFRKHFRQGHAATGGHPVYIYDKKNDSYKFVGLTHSTVTRDTINIKLDKNPNPKSDKSSYIRPKPDEKAATKKNFGKQLSGWSFAESDKPKVQSVINKGKDKKKS